MKIALDVDGVLADVIVSWLNYSNSIRSPISKNQITDWEFWKKFKIYTKIKSNTRLPHLFKHMSTMEGRSIDLRAQGARKQLRSMEPF